MALTVNDRRTTGGAASGDPVGRIRRWLRQPPHQWIYRNLTPWRIEFRDGEHDDAPLLTIPPLGETRVFHADAAMWNTSPLRERGQLEVVPAPDDLLARLPQLLVVGGWLLIAALTSIVVAVGGWDAVPVRAVATAALAAPLVAFAGAVVRELVHGGQLRRFSDEWREARRSRSTLGVAAYDGTSDRLATQLTRRTTEAFVLVGSAAVAVVGTGVAIYGSSQLRQLLPIDLTALVHLRDPFHGATSAARNSGAVWQLLIGHVAQWVLVSVAALVPAAMYFQFDRERLAAIQSRWVRHVFRLDPTVRTLGDIQAKYGSSIESSFGLLGPLSTSRLRRGRRSPVIVATVLSTVGWVVLACGAPVPALVLDNGRYRWDTPDGVFPVPAFFTPQGTALGFAFLGAYLFAVFHCVRGYQRRDLLPKTYNVVVVRYLAAYILTLAGTALLPDVTLKSDVLIGFAFFAGFLPQRYTVRLAELARSRRFVPAGRELDQGVPLTELEGIDLYDRTRLEEEGINNVHALAHADLVELMSATRIPADRLVDWTDQAILFLRVGGEVLGSPPRRPSGDGPAPRGGRRVARRAARRRREEVLERTRQNMRHLRGFGIRNASDLVQAYEKAVKRASNPAHPEDASSRLSTSAQAEVDQLRGALSSNGMPADETTGYLPIQGMLDTLPDEEWFTQIRNWRRSEFGKGESWSVYLDGVDPCPKRRDPPCRPLHDEEDLLERSFPMRRPTT